MGNLILDKQFTIPQGLLDQVARTFRTPEPLDKIRAAIADLQPRDDLEAMLIAQMIGCCNMAMRFTDRAMNTKNNVAFMDKYTNIAAKMMRTYALQMETLKKHRDGWGQKMVVEHVNVEAGGKAIIGPVSHDKT